MEATLADQVDILVSHSRRYVRYYCRLWSCHCSSYRWSLRSVINAKFIHVCWIAARNCLAYGADHLNISGFMHLAAGLSVGLSGIAAGYTIGIVGDAVRLSKYSMAAHLSNE